MGIQVKQCKDCNKLFHSFGGDLCLECSEKVDGYFRQVRDYLYAHPDAGILEVTKNTGVEESYILSFLKEERLSLNKESEYIKCEQCKNPITSGRLCSACKERLSTMLDTVVMPEKKDQKPKQKSSLRSGPGKLHLKYGDD